MNEIREKELILCQEEMEQGRAVRDRVAAGAWAEAKAGAEAEWVDHLPQDPAETVYVRTADIQYHMSPDNPVIKETALSAVRK